MCRLGSRILPSLDKARTGGKLAHEKERFFGGFRTAASGSSGFLRPLIDFAALRSYFSGYLLS